MPDQEKIDNLPRKMSLSPAERKIIEAHRAKTVADRGFNEGLGAAVKILDDIIDSRDSISLADVRGRILSARRDV